ncbi:NAD(P)-dependent alcohol dehydrogenase [Chryseobacterium sp. W4I1]|uniref:zinc-dependent alcohol dehydrogenase family protein n=1 Tax=Chryseobacterium sp. W4I1 TaxID=3042293 RepID=UPI00278B2492|nr:NAD(P)-dependent alcohol dehydrogenase [Chryseobacterium sp. W4I1]MDQ0781295.1 NADPH:quinone reductase-like Zn-dependent oxidoreductase [Chryseobacterium sp. W4I1]
MKTYKIQNSNLVQVEQQLPEIKVNEVLIKVRAVSLNFRDLILLEKNIENRIPTSDAAGEIIEIGSEVRSLQKGDKVTTLIVPNWQNGKLTSEKLKGALGSSQRDGVLAEYIVMHENDVVKFPDYLSFAEASTLPVAGLTAWNAVVENSNAKLGDTILIVGTGGVSLFALKFAKYSGLKIIMTSSSDKKLEKLKQMGAHFTLNYKSNKDWINDILEYTSGEGVDQIIDVVGGSHLNDSIKCVKSEGIVKMVGILGRIRRNDKYKQHYAKSS